MRSDLRLTLGLWLGLGLSLWLLLLPWGGRADEVDEASLKAAYLFNFAKFVSSPVWEAEGAEAPFRFCVLGHHPFGDALARLPTKQVRQHPILVEYLRATAPLGACRVLFIGAAEEPRLRRLLPVLKDRPILTVSDLPGFTRLGGMIEMLQEGQRLRFEINLAAAKAAGLSLSPKLLRLAKTGDAEGGQP
jgi:hypothetical protein